LNRALNVDASLEPRTAGGLTLEDVLIRLRHPNSGIRKETLGGLKDIVNAGGAEWDVGKVVRGIGGVLADEVSAVTEFELMLRMQQFARPYLPS
jgi:pre-rRNA-processing protein IPI1